MHPLQGATLRQFFFLPSRGMTKKKPDFGREAHNIKFSKSDCASPAKSRKRRARVAHSHDIELDIKYQNRIHGILLISRAAQAH
jgi:hypothetical protein